MGMVGFEHPRWFVVSATVGPAAGGVGFVGDPDDYGSGPRMGRSMGLALAPGAVYTYDFVEEHQRWLGGSRRRPVKSLAGAAPVGRLRGYIFCLQATDRLSLIEHPREPRYWRIAGAFDCEVAVGVFPAGIRANVNPVELLDFLTGWVGVDPRSQHVR